MKRPEFFNICMFQNLGISEAISFFEEKGFSIPKDNYKKSVFASDADKFGINCQRFYLFGDSFYIIYSWYGTSSSATFYVSRPLSEYDLKNNVNFKFHNPYGPAISYPLIDHYYIDGKPIDEDEFFKQMAHRRIKLSL